MQITNTDLLSRYLLEKKKFRPSTNTVRYNAFMPARDNKYSVFNIKNLEEKEIWSIGMDYVAKIQQKPLLARAEIFVKNVKELSLDVESEPSTHERHANICSYPQERSEIQMIATELSNRARLVMNH